MRIQILTCYIYIVITIIIFTYCRVNWKKINVWRFCVRIEFLFYNIQNARHESQWPTYTRINIYAGLRTRRTGFNVTNLNSNATTGFNKQIEYNVKNRIRSVGKIHDKFVLFYNVIIDSCSKTSFKATTNNNMY